MKEISHSTSTIECHEFSTTVKATRICVWPETRKWRKEKEN
jgi:hypothetical protein